MRFIRAIVVVALFTACGTSGQHVAPISDIEARYPVTSEGDFAALTAEAEAAWEQRSDRAELVRAIDLWEEALTTDSDGDRADALFPILVSLSRAYYFLGDGNMRFDDLPRNELNAAMHANYEVGIRYAREAMAASNEEWNRALLYEQPVPQAVLVTTADDIPAMYWFSANLGRWAILDGTPTILAHKDDIRAIMNRIQELDRSYFYGASDRYFGAYWSKLPIGDPNVDLAHEHFLTAIEIEPNYLGTRVLFAEEYARVMGDRDLFVEQLEYVLSADLDALPDVRPENEAEQRKAELLMARIDDLFR